MDTGLTSGTPQNVWYERGFNTNAPATGLPPARVTFASLAAPDHQYVLQDFRSNNAVLINGTRTNAVLELHRPVRLSSISFLASAGGGDGSIRVSAQHEDGGNQSAVFQVFDWFDGTNAAHVADGRFDLVSRRFNSVNSGNPRLFSYDLFLTNNSPVVRVQFTFQRRTVDFSLRNIAIFALSGSLGAGFTPIDVSGFEHDLVIEAGYRGFEWPDLQGLATGLTPPAPAPGDAVQATFRTSNTGAGASPASAVDFYLSAKSLSLYLGRLAIPPIPRSGSSISNFQFQLPANLPIGRYSLNWRLNPEDAFDEYRTNDNIGFVQFGVGPNLVIVPEEIAAEMTTAGRAVTFAFAVRNEGTPSSTVKATIYFGIGWGPSANALPMAELEIPALTAGDPAFQGRLTFIVPDSFPAGGYSTSAWIDSGQNVSEFSEDDNRSGMYVSIPAPPERLILTATVIAPREIRVTAPSLPLETILQQSTDLREWTELQRFPANEPIAFTVNATAPQSFYRLLPVTGAVPSIDNFRGRVLSMARKPRIQYPGAVYHVMSRGDHEPQLPNLRTDSIIN